jgi:phage-related minor tail protein
MLADMGQNLLKFALNSAWGGVAENIAGMQSGGGGGLFSSILGAAFGVAPAASSTATATPFANGGVFSSPVGFSMGSGQGVMGENGSEAIMPLTRIGGKLGVRANAGGGGGGTSVVQTFHITVEGGDDNPDRIVSALRPVMREEAAKVFSRRSRERVG